MLVLQVGIEPTNRLGKSQVLFLTSFCSASDENLGLPGTTVNPCCAFFLPGVLKRFEPLEGFLRRLKVSHTSRRVNPLLAAPGLVMNGPIPWCAESTCIEQISGLRKVGHDFLILSDCHTLSTLFCNNWYAVLCCENYLGVFHTLCKTPVTCNYYLRNLGSRRVLLPILIQ